MATTNPTAVNQLYPFSTGDKQSIPLDIIEGISSLQVNSEVFNLSEIDSVLVYLWSEDGCYVVPSATTVIVMGTAIPGAIFVPPSHVITAKLSPISYRMISRIASPTNFLYITVIRKWAGLALAQQLKSSV